MEQKELRIGNSIYDTLDREEREVCLADYLREHNFNSFADLKPNLLTEEWLLRSGIKLECIPKAHRGKYYQFTIDGILYYYFTDKNQIEKHRSHMIYKYVHSFQNLYFALTGKELPL